MVDIINGYQTAAAAAETVVCSRLGLKMYTSVNTAYRQTDRHTHTHYILVI